MYLYYVFLCIYILQKKDIFTNVWVCWGDLRVLFSHPNLDHVTEAAPLLGTISPFLFWLAGVPFLFCVMFTMFHVFSALPSHRFPACIPRCAVDRNTGLLESREFWPDNGISLCPRHCETLHYIIGSLSAIISSLAQWFKPKQRDTHFAGLISSPPSNYWHKAPLWAHTVLLPLKQHMTTQAYKDKRRPVTQTCRCANTWPREQEKLPLQILGRQNHASMKVVLFYLNSNNNTHSHTSTDEGRYI